MVATKRGHSLFCGSGRGTAPRAKSPSSAGNIPSDGTLRDVPTLTLFFACFILFTCLMTNPHYYSEYYASHDIAQSYRQDIG